MAPRISVVIPSRSQPAQASFLARAVASIRAQSAASAVTIEVIICLDKGAVRPELPDSGAVRFVESLSLGQAAALNAGAERSCGDYLAFLEDDDQWSPERIALALSALESGDFTSTTQLEIDANDQVVKINDFPTPSGWFMPMSSWHRIGPFDETFAWHLDNEWLGRLGDSGLKRIHLVEATAPIEPKFFAEVRPMLLHCLRLGGPKVILGRHSLPVPLVTRMVHPKSGMGTIEREPEAQQAARREGERLISRFGRYPW